MQSLDIRLVTNTGEVYTLGIEPLGDGPEITAVMVQSAIEKLLNRLAELGIQVPRG